MELGEQRRGNGMSEAWRWDGRDGSSNALRMHTEMTERDNWLGTERPAEGQSVQHQQHQDQVEEHWTILEAIRDMGSSRRALEDKSLDT